MDTQHSPIEEKILERIHEKNIHQRPKWRFVVEAGGVAVAIVAGAMIVLALISLAVFNARQNGTWYVSGFGSQGLHAFFFLLPWKLITLSIVFLIGLQVLVQKYSPIYHQPMLYSGIALVVLALAIGYLIAPFHKRVIKSIRQNQLPFAAPFYNQLGPEKSEDVERGIIVSTTTHGFIIRNGFGSTSSVLVEPRTQLMMQKPLDIGDTIVIFRTQSEPGKNGKKAFGIRAIIDPDFDSDN